MEDAVPARKKVSKAKAAKFKKIIAQARADWIAGTNNDFTSPDLGDALRAEGCRIPYWYPPSMILPPTLRLTGNLSIGGPWVQSSRTGIITTEDCKEIWDRVEKVRAKGVDWRQVNRTRPYLSRVKSISAKGELRIGCQKIRYSEMKRIATELGWVKAPAPRYAAGGRAKR